MERFTKKRIVAGIERSYVNDDDCFDTWSVPRKYEGPAIERLAAYEDTGLEPEEVLTVKENAEVACALNLLKEYRSVGSVEHFRELISAERDGRLVALPCKVGDTVYFTVEGRWNTATIDHIEIYPDEVRFGWVEYDVGPELTELWEEGCFTVEDIGKTVFLTREEAEGALKKEEGGEL